MSRVCRMGQAHHLSAAVLVLQSYSEQALLLRCLVKIESAFEINNIPRDRVTRVAEMTCSCAGLHRIFGRDSVAQIPRKEVRSYSPMLSGGMAAASDEGLDAVVRTSGQQRDALNSSRLAWRAGHSAEAELQYLPFLPGDGAVAPMLTRAQLCTNKTPTAPKAIPRKSACRNAVPRAKSKYREARRESPPGVVYLSRKG